MKGVVNSAPFFYIARNPDHECLWGHTSTRRDIFRESESGRYIIGITLCNSFTWNVLRWGNVQPSDYQGAVWFYRGIFPVLIKENRMSCEKYKFRIAACKEGVVYLPQSIFEKARSDGETTGNEDGSEDYMFVEDINKYLLEHQANHTHEDGHKH